MKTLAERLKFAMETATPKKVRGVDLARAVGVKPPSVSDWLSGKSKKMEGENLLKASKCLGVNPTWLANGQGEMRPLSQSQTLGTMTQNQSGQSSSEPQLFTQIDKNFRMAHIRFSKPDGSRPTVKIPVYRDVKAACGDGFENFLEDPSDHVEMEPMVLKMLGIECKPENLKIIYSVEDSMWPTVPHDKPLFIDVSDRDPSAIKSGKIYVFTYAYGCRMKRIFMGYNEDENKRNIRLASDNPDKNEYPDEWITKEQLNEINFIGRLVWTGKEL
ncbi:MAG: helix-turn-helix transcriptional regulator [Moraxellaceae bacterium]|nr:MAG: helix-turn-helix transcriptional regulator [Moraxellaceae bacterium]